MPTEPRPQAAREEDTAIVIDLGKTNCRLEVRRGSCVLASVSGSGAPGLAARDGVAAAVRAIASVADRLEPALARAARACAVGAAGALTDDVARTDLAVALGDHLGVPTAVTSDLVIAHAAAFGGDPGCVLIAGTGAVAVGIDSASELVRVDGWGPRVGDQGGGYWIGRAYLRRLLRESDGRASSHGHPDGYLPAGMETPAELLLWVTHAESPVARLASLSELVLRVARTGDRLAVDVVTDAARHLADTARAASLGGSLPVCVLGGLTRNAFFRRLLGDVLAAAGLRTLRAESEATDGAAFVATSRSTIYERFISRA